MRTNVLSGLALASLLIAGTAFAQGTPAPATNNPNAAAPAAAPAATPAEEKKADVKAEKKAKKHAKKAKKEATEGAK